MKGHFILIRKNSFHYSKIILGFLNIETAWNGSGSTFVYDDAGKINSLAVGTKNGDILLEEHYRYDENGNRTKIEYPDGSDISYEYDSSDQLTKESLKNGTEKSYKYDGFGNRTNVNVTSKEGEISTDAEYNSANQLTKFGNEKITYDQNGNRLSDGKYMYGWNAADQLISITKKEETAPFAKYVYDEDGRRIQKTVDGKVTNYYYDGDSLNVLYETDEKDKVVRSYVYSQDGQLLAIRKGSDTYFYHYNAHGDVIALTDKENNIVADYQYDAWGNVLQSDEQDSVKDNPYRYAGYQFDKETGLYYLMARYYNPNHGVFLTNDSQPGEINDILSQNGYNYALNNPVKHIDPNGENAIVFKLAALGIKVAGKYVVKAGKWLFKKIAGVFKRKKKVPPYSHKVKEKLAGKYKHDKYHNFPKLLDKEILSTKPVLKRSDGRIEYCAKGSIEGQKGIYSITVKKGKIIHRAFIKKAAWQKFAKNNHLPSYNKIK